MYSLMKYHNVLKCDNYAICGCIHIVSRKYICGSMCILNLSIAPVNPNPSRLLSSPRHPTLGVGTVKELNKLKFTALFIKCSLIQNHAKNLYKLWTNQDSCAIMVIAKQNLILLTVKKGVFVLIKTQQL